MGHLRASRQAGDALPSGWTWECFTPIEALLPPRIVRPCSLCIIITKAQDAPTVTGVHVQDWIWQLLGTDAVGVGAVHLSLKCLP